ncbi:MAG: 16S rRNA (cytosine(1402)-N(4))-methyltransferase RsmH [Acidimicrobiia bacterium]|nr:16S rRNA (cytosine(1402)-N(4))-methyltransferase RsmH [Acidimicrobiia bacterium]
MVNQTNHNDESSTYHQPVMSEEVVRWLGPIADNGIVVDATFGGGGHTRSLMSNTANDIEMVVIDRDPDALANASDLGDSVTAIEGNFAQLGDMLVSQGITAVAGVLFDLGVSSHHLDVEERGFSYRRTGPLDMRMGADTDLTAAEIINDWPEDDIAQTIRSLGEEPRARRIARAIVDARPLTTTTELAAVIEVAVAGGRPDRRHPARRTFQALRMTVNDELDSIRAGLDSAIDILGPGGRCVVISYHSLEDRIVKRRFVDGATGCVCPPDLPVCVCGREPELKILTKKPKTPSADEIAQNPRARSAKLRVAERIAS